MINVDKISETCPHCEGRKYVYNTGLGCNESCPTCNGSGRIAKQSTGPQISFTGGSRNRDCQRCDCSGYKRKSTNNSDCGICGHPQSYHFSQR